MESLSYLSQSNKRPRRILCYFFKLSLWPRGDSLRVRNEINVLRVWNSFENSFGISLTELLWEERRKNGRKNWYSWKRKDEALIPLKWEVKRRKKRFKNVNAFKIISQITNTNYLTLSQGLPKSYPVQYQAWNPVIFMTCIKSKCKCDSLGQFLQGQVSGCGISWSDDLGTKKLSYLHPIYPTYSGETGTGKPLPTFKKVGAVEGK